LYEFSYSWGVAAASEALMIDGMHKRRWKRARGVVCAVPIGLTDYETLTINGWMLEYHVLGQAYVFEIGQQLTETRKHWLCISAHYLDRCIDLSQIMKD
jgi:hypothetical protein